MDYIDHSDNSFDVPHPFGSKTRIVTALRGLPHLSNSFFCCLGKLGLECDSFGLKRAKAFYRRIEGCGMSH